MNARVILLRHKWKGICINFRNCVKKTYRFYTVIIIINNIINGDT